MNRYIAVLGEFNCRGATWNNIERKNIFHQTKSESLTGYIRGRDIHLITEVAMDPNGIVSVQFIITEVVNSSPYHIM